MQHVVQAEPAYVFDVDSQLPALDRAIGSNHAAITIKQTDELRHRIGRKFPLLLGSLQRLHIHRFNLSGPVHARHDLLCRSAFPL
jgi:hypothetical protein